MRQQLEARVGLGGQLHRLLIGARCIAEHLHFQLLPCLPTAGIGDQRARVAAEVEEVLARAVAAICGLAEDHAVVPILGRDDAQCGVLAGEGAIVRLRQHGAVGLRDGHVGIILLLCGEPHAHDFRREPLAFLQRDFEMILIFARCGAVDRHAERRRLRFVGRILFLVGFLLHRVGGDVKKPHVRDARGRDCPEDILADPCIRRDFQLCREFPALRRAHAEHLDPRLVEKQRPSVCQPCSREHDLRFRPALRDRWVHVADIRRARPRDGGKGDG